MIGTSTRPGALRKRPASRRRFMPFREAKREFERQYVTRLLRAARGNCAEAARIAEKDRKDFYDLMRRAGVRPGDFR